MNKLFNQSLFEQIYKWKHFDIAKISNEIEKLSNLSPEEFTDWQDKKKWAMVQHHFENNPFYQQIIGAELPVKWSDLPVINKKDLQIELTELITRPCLLKDLYVNNTSGSSGHPLRFVKDYYTQARVWAAKKLFFKLHGIDIGSKEAKFYGMPKSRKAHWIQRIKDFILNRKRFVIFDLSDHVFDQWIKVFEKTKFEYIYGYTSAIVLFSRYLISKNIVLTDRCPSLKTVMVTSESCSPEDKIIIKQACGIDARNEYGTADVGLIGYECQQGSIHIVEENIFVEINDANELLVTDLFNKAFPFIRYKIGDVAEFSGGLCSCGAHNRVINELQGRTNDVARLKSGKIVPGLTFYYISRALLESSGVLQEFIIRQTALDTFEFDVVSNAPLQPGDIKELKKTAEEYLEPGLNIIVNQLDKIERPASGKLKHFYSELNLS